MKRSLQMLAGAMLFALIGGGSAQAQGRRGVNTPAAPTAPAFYPIPVQSYALVDVSGTSAPSDVKAIALDDDNHVAFTYKDTTPQRTNIIVKTWQNGVVTPDPVQTLPMHQVLAYAPAPYDTTPVYTRDIVPYTQDYYLRANGQVLGTVFDMTYMPQYHFDGTIAGYIPKTWFYNGFTATGGSISPFGAPVPPYLPDPTDPATMESPFPPNDFTMFAANEKAYAGYDIGCIGKNSAGLYTAHGGYLLVSYASSTVFDTKLTASSPDASVNVSNSGLQLYTGPKAINASGWALGYTGTYNSYQYYAWNGRGTVPLTGPGEAINDSNDILVAGTWDAGGTLQGGGLLDQGGNFIPFVDDATKKGLIPTQYQKQLRSIYPSMLSNRLNVQGSGVQPVLNIVFSAETRRNALDDPWSWGKFLLRKLSDGTVILHEVDERPYFANYFFERSINSSGLLAGSGVLKPDFGDPSHVHAALLVPAKFDVNDGRINYGFDPPMKGLPAHKPPIPDDPPDEVWASVVKGESNQNVKWVLPQSFASSTKLHIAGEDAGHPNAFLNFSPKDSPLSAAETTLTLNGLSSGDGNDDPESHPIKDVEIQAQLVGNSQKIRSLMVKVLPKRVVSVGICRVADSTSPATALVNAPSDAEIISTLNDIYIQAGITFQLDDSETIDCAYDADSDGRLEDTEIKEILIPVIGMPGKVHIILAAQSGYPYKDDSSQFQRANTRPLVGFAYSFLFVQTILEAKGTVSLIAAHEMGHALDLTSRNPDAGFHDPGPFPERKGLMSSGAPDPVSRVAPANPGRWLPHEDWQTANTKANDYKPNH